jgi:hypothetical protein
MARKARQRSVQYRDPQREGTNPPAPQLSSEVTIMKKPLFTAGAAITVLTAAFFVGA